jgi:hypothetical protein
MPRNQGFWELAFTLAQCGEALVDNRHAVLNLLEAAGAEALI